MSDKQKTLNAAIHWFIAGFSGLFGVIAAATVVDLVVWVGGRWM